MMESSCPFCDQQLVEVDKVMEPCCGEQELENTDGMNTCMNCGLVHGYDYVTEYIGYDGNRFIIGNIIFRMCWIVYLLSIRDCSLFMPKGGSVIFKQFRHMKNLPLPGSRYFKKLPPVYVTGPKCNPPSTPTPLPSGRDVPPIAKLRKTRVLAGLLINQNPLL